MVDLKEIKTIKIVPFTLMTSSISAIWGFIFAILFLLFAGVALAMVSAIPSTAGLGNVNISSIATGFIAISIALIIIAPVYAFISNITAAFLTTLIYNLLVPRFNGIQLKIEDLRHVREIPVVPFALITAAVAAVIAFIFALIYGPYTGALLSINSALTGFLTAIGIIILTPIAAFIGVFIVMALSAIFYNVLAPKIGGIKLNFANVQDTLFSLDSIEIVPFALITAAVAAVWGLILGILYLIIFIIAGSALAAIIGLIATPIVVFIISFIVYAITVFLYNLLAPRIGGIKLNLE
ncbi:MAG: hypothetical protein ACXVHY_04880 [Methanobacterium sp.]